MLACVALFKKWLLFKDDTNRRTDGPMHRQTQGKNTIHMDFRESTFFNNDEYKRKKLNKKKD